LGRGNFDGDVLNFSLNFSRERKVVSSSVGFRDCSSQVFADVERFGGGGTRRLDCLDLAFANRLAIDEKFARTTRDFLKLLERLLFVLHGDEYRKHKRPAPKVAQVSIGRLAAVNAAFEGISI
jgi:hypothetical protein